MRMRWVNAILMVALIIGSPLLSVQGAPAPSERVPASAAPPRSSDPFVSPVPGGVLPEATGDYQAAIAKLHPTLRKALENAGAGVSYGAKPAAQPAEPLIVQVVAAPGAELKRYFETGTFIERPLMDIGGAEIQFVIGKVQPRNLAKLASVAQVQTVLPIEFSKTGQPMDYPADDIASRQPRQDWATLQANASKLRANMPAWADARAYGDGQPRPEPAGDGLVLAADPHNVMEAWEKGYMGEGVTVAVLDDGIDFGHPDLMGTQRLYNSDQNSQYNGWPVAFSPFSMLAYALEWDGIEPLVSTAFSGIGYVDTSTIPNLRPGTPAGTYVFEYTPWIDWGMLGIEHTYTIAQSMTKSGVVHVGTHPDVDLRDYVWGEKVAVLVCDPNSAGVYDTVYVDLDDDYDFRNEKPLTRADMSDPNTYNNMICYRDFDGDGIADLSGGALYFIADGVNVLPGSDYLYGAEPGGFLCPGNGDLVAFTGGSFGYDYSHGTQCASAIAGQGIINAKVPTFAEGSVGGAVLGVAPKAKLVDVSDIYWNFDSSLIDAYLFVAIGYDGVTQSNLDMATGGLAADTDPIQVVSNSYGYSDMDNDGWDYLSQVVAVLMNFWAPYQQYTFSTGNGGPGFGTAAPPSPITAVLVGASTEFSATGWDSITSTAQINVNDVIPFSNRGPGANGRTGVNVVASGAYAPGDEALNYYGMAMWGWPDGTLCWDSWGGTSRSSPVAAGVLALIYDAWFQTTNQWPEGAAAKIVLQSTATDLKYDVLSQGSGSVNGGAAVDVASRQSGLIALIPEANKGTTEWQPGDYHGVDYPAFAHVIEPGATDTTEVRVADFSSPMQPTLARDVELKLIKQDEFDFTVTPQMVDGEYDYGFANRDNFYKAFQYMIPITAVPGMDDSWYNLDVPPDTELMVVRALFPFDELDTDGNYIQDNRFYLMVYNWTDINGNGIVWDDKDGNGVVNIINRPEVIFDYDLIDGGMELNWDDPRNELDRYEYARFGYHRPTSNRLEMWVSDPLGRMQDGLFIGLRHLPPDRYSGATHLKFRVEYYSKQDCPWLELSSSGDTTSTGAVIVPPATDLFATAAPPADMKPGIYEAAIEIVRLPTGAEPFEADPDQIAPDLWEDPVIVPVVMTVVQPMPTAGGDWQFGGEETYSDAYNAGRLYNNGCVRGQFDWSWRTESGDWRFFFQDLPEDAIMTEGRSHLIVQDQWDGPAPYNDIDTIVLGPRYDWGDHPSQLGFYAPEYFGPYTLDEIARSPIVLFGDATWMFNTSSGANEDWVGAPLYNSGLHAILQHHVLADGDNFDIVFTKTLGLMDINPPSLEVETCTAAGELGEVTISSNIGFDELMVEAYGLGYVQKFEGLEIPFDGVQGSWDATITVEHAGAMVFVIDSVDISDLDLYLYYLGPTGAEDFSLVASSTTPEADEYIQVILPADGVYWLLVDNWAGPSGHFDLAMLLAMGHDLTVTGAPSGPVTPGSDVTLKVHYSGADYLGSIGPLVAMVDAQGNMLTPSADGTMYYGLLSVGPRDAPALGNVWLQVERQLCEPEPVDLQLTVKPAKFCPSHNLEYTLKLTNTSGQALTNLVITDPLPAMTSYVSASGSTGVAASYNSGTNTITWTKAALASGASLTLSAVIHSYTSMPDNYLLTNTFHYGEQSIATTAMSDEDLCDTEPPLEPTRTATPSPTATVKPTATPTGTPKPQYRLLIPLISRHVS